MEREPANSGRLLFGKMKIAGMAGKKLVIPTFGSESEEAAWWEKHRAAVEGDLRAAMREGVTMSLGEVMAQVKRKKELPPVTIRLASEDIATARQLAEDKGIGYQTYIELLLHEALQRQAARQTPSGK
jgi:predicted DNA binding CopG/RHH family protein